MLTPVVAAWAVVNTIFPYARPGSFNEKLCTREIEPTDQPDPTSASVSVVEEIRGLKALLDEGILTQDVK